jgi:hypothetical protein
MPQLTISVFPTPGFAHYWSWAFRVDGKGERGGVTEDQEKAVDQAHYAAANWREANGFNPVGPPHSLVSVTTEDGSEVNSRG